MCLQSSQYKTVERLVQTLKNLCCALDEVETQNITEAVKRLRHSVNLPRTHSPKVGSGLHTHKHTITNTHKLTDVFHLCSWTLDPLDTLPMVSGAGQPQLLMLHIRLP